MTGRPARPRLVATDLDGTLLRDDGRVSARTARVLKDLHEAGIDVIFVTARPPRWLDDVAASVAGHGTVICLNGAFVYDTSARRVIAEVTMAEPVIRSLVADLRGELPTIKFAVERTGGLAAERDFRDVHEIPADIVLGELIEEVLDDGTGKLLARCPEVADAEVVARIAAVVGDRAVVSDSGAVGLAEIGGPGVTKAATLALWAAERGVRAHDVWAFGDMPNDLPMLAWAGRSFAVANAHPAVRAAADHICGSNQDDGVAAELEHLVR